METALIKKAKQLLQHSHEIDMVEKSVNNFLTYQTLLHSISLLRLSKKHLQESVSLNSDLLTWIQASKRNKKSFLMMWMNFMCTCSICKMESLFVAIQILIPVENGMIGLWSDSTMLVTRYLAERNQLECGLTIIFQVRCCVFCYS